MNVDPSGKVCIPCAVVILAGLTWLLSGCKETRDSSYLPRPLHSQPQAISETNRRAILNSTVAIKGGGGLVQLPDCHVEELAWETDLGLGTLINNGQIVLHDHLPSDFSTRYRYIEFRGSNGAIRVSGQNLTWEKDLTYIFNFPSECNPTDLGEGIPLLALTQNDILQNPEQYLDKDVYYVYGIGPNQYENIDISRRWETLGIGVATLSNLPYELPESVKIFPYAALNGSWEEIVEGDSGGGVFIVSDSGEVMHIGVIQGINVLDIGGMSRQWARVSFRLRNLR
jgi:hypothetical protein